MRLRLIAAILLASACSGPKDPTDSASTGPVQSSGSEPAAPSASDRAPAPSSKAYLQKINRPPLNQALDCLRQERGLLLIGHRGGPTRDFPENAIETLERTLKAGTRGMEIDVGQTKDGVLILMHDDELDRTTTGEGLVSDRTWAEVSQLRLETNTKVTDFHPPRLEDALAWGVRNNVLLELDKKKSAPFDPIIAAVRAAKAENHVFIITYTDEQAIEVHTKAPDLVITATVRSPLHLDDLIAKGVKADRLVAWTGTEEPNLELWQALIARNIEPAFGTLGPRSSSLDSRYWEDDDGSEYIALSVGGLPILVTDLTDKVSRELKSEIVKAVRCGL